MNFYNVMNKKLWVVLFFSFCVNVALAEVTLLSHPQDSTVRDGEVVSFNVLASGGAPLVYQWQDSSSSSDWQNIDLATDSILAFSAGVSQNGFSYRCILTDTSDADMDTSLSAVLTVEEYNAPQILSNPKDTSVEEGNSVFFNVVAIGTDLSYQWKKDSTDISGATSATYVTGALTLADDGAMYTCIISNDSGMVTSAAATLSVTPAAEDYNSWPHSVSFLVNTQSNWANLNDTVLVTDIPVVIQFDSNYFDFSQSTASGADLRFAKEDGTHLPFSIEVWDVTKGLAAIWVKLDSIQGNSEQKVMMYFGNTGVETASNSGAVFPNSDGFKAVWHLNEAGNNDSTGYKDATPEANDGTGKGMSGASQVKGVVGAAQSFTGSSNWIDVGPFNELSDGVTTGISFWIKGLYSEQPASWMRAFDGLDDSLGMSFQISNTQPTISMRIDTDSGVVNDNKPFDNAMDNKWHHVYGHLNNGEWETFLDGKSIGKGTYNQAKGFAGAALAYIAGNRRSPNSFKGIMDEFRINSTPRSADWIKVGYENQRPNQALISNPISAGCVDSFSVASDTLNIDELESFSIPAVANCALRSGWYQVNGAEETPLQVQGLTLEASMGRVKADTAFTYRFKALFASGWDSLDVVVNVKAVIINPEFTLTVQNLTGEWDGLDTIFVAVNVTNLSAIQALPSPANEINYMWGRSGVTVAVQESDSLLTLIRGYSTGVSNISLCLNNGGPVVCDTVNIDVVSTQTPEQLAKSPIDFEGNYLIWNTNARIQVWAVNGKLLFNEWGLKGKRVQVPAGILRSIRQKRSLVQIQPLK